MKSISALLFTVVLSLFCRSINAQDANPFMEMAGKKYADYSWDLYYKYLNFSSIDTIERQKMMEQIKETALKTGSKAWELELKYAELALFDINNRGKSKDYVEKEIKMAFDLLEEAKKNHILYMELKVRHDIIETYWLKPKNYELAFEQCAIQAERLQTVSSSEIPEKAVYYLQIANNYFYFNDYSKAMDYFQKILNEKGSVYEKYNKPSALNGLGLCYLNGYNDLDRSDSCFQAIMQINYTDSAGNANRDKWVGIVEGNIGYNMLLRGEYDRAIPLLKSSIEKMLEYGDYAFASGDAVNLAKIYLNQGNISEAKQYIDLARDYNTRMPRDGRLQLIYETLNKYYAAVGDTKLSMAYMDSTLQAKEQFDKQYNALLLHRLDQKEVVKQQQELFREKEVRKHVQIRLLIISISFAAISILSVLLFFLYFKIRDAYRELVRKSQQWAKVKPVPEPEYDASPDKFDLSIMDAIERLMQEKKVYQDCTLSIDALANLLGYKKHLVSEAINHCTNTNFHTFINEYRVKEAIRLLSDKNAKADSLDMIATVIGFNNRISFHRAFKKITGLSPAKFRKNVVS